MENEVKTNISTSFQLAIIKKVSKQDELRKALNNSYNWTGLVYTLCLEKVLSEIEISVL